MMDEKVRESTTTLKRMFAVVTAPIAYVLSFVIPNCKEPEYEKYYLVTFLLSGASIAAFSYVLVWMMAVIGELLTILRFGIQPSTWPKIR